MGSRESFSTVNSLSRGLMVGLKSTKVVDAMGNDLDYTINKTMMRVDLPSPLRPGEKMIFSIDWWYINDRIQSAIRIQYLQEEDNYLYTIAQFYPRLAVYSDNEGWQSKQFLGSGEFTLFLVTTEWQSQFMQITSLRQLVS